MISKSFFNVIKNRWLAVLDWWHGICFTRCVSRRRSVQIQITGWVMAIKRSVEVKKTPARVSAVRGVESGARDLSKHFCNKPEAGDTLEGIADWWVARQRRSNAVDVVRSALEHLVGEGKVSKRNYGEKELYVVRRSD